MNYDFVPGPISSIYRSMVLSLASERNSSGAFGSVHSCRGKEKGGLVWGGGGGEETETRANILHAPQRLSPHVTDPVQAAGNRRGPL